jgi:F0F1-type ATP synthase membrane subunit b/b'
LLYWGSTLQDRLNADIQHKTQLKQQVEQQLQQDMQRFKDMEREAAALISKARHANSKLMVSHSNQHCTGHACAVDQQHSCM